MVPTASKPRTRHNWIELGCCRGHAMNLYGGPLKLIIAHRVSDSYRSEEEAGCGAPARKPRSSTKLLQPTCSLQTRKYNNNNNFNENFSTLKIHGLSDILLYIDTDCVKTSLCNRVIPDFCESSHYSVIERQTFFPFGNVTSKDVFVSPRILGASISQ